MAIPKIIHYCWFGGNPLPDEIKKYIETWKKVMPDYEIHEWNESNIDLSANQFIQDAYQNRKFAFVSDYARLYALYHEGGFYLDTDIEVLKRFDDFLHYDLALGFESKEMIESAFIGASKENELILEFLNLYNTKVFDLNNLVPNTEDLTRLVEKRGFIIDGNQQVTDTVFIGTNEYFFGFDYNEFAYCVNENTYTIHHCLGSWTSTKEKIVFKTKRILRTLLGRKGYLVLKKLMK